MDIRKNINLFKNSQDELASFFLDVILSFLGAGEKAYKYYKTQIRFDYLWIEDHDFIEKRKIILQRLLDRERIFITDQMYGLFEEKARNNMKLELESS